MNDGWWQESTLATSHVMQFCLRGQPAKQLWLLGKEVDSSICSACGLGTIICVSQERSAGWPISHVGALVQIWMRIFRYCCSRGKAYYLDTKHVWIMDLLVWEWLLLVTFKKPYCLP